MGNECAILLLFLLSSGRPIVDHLSLSSVLSHASSLGGPAGLLLTWLPPYAHVDYNPLHKQVLTLLA